MKSTILLHIYFLVVLSTAVLFAQNDGSKKTINEKKIKQEAVKENSTGKIKTPQATGDKINFKDEDGNSLITITDEGTTGSITIPSATFSVSAVFSVFPHRYWSQQGWLW